MKNNLGGVHVLIDGYNLELAQGTGIATVCLTLIDALKALKADVNVLSSSRATRNQILNEVLFFDARPKRLGVSHILGALKAVSGVGLRPRPIEIGRIVSKVNVGRFHRDVVPSTGIYALGDCYQISNTLHRMFGMTTCISNPGKVDIWHATSPLPIKVKKTRKITTIHDIIPLRLPHMTAEDKKAFFMNIHNSIRDSDLIMCDSENTKTDVLEFFDVDPDRLHVVYLPIALDVRWPDKERIYSCLERYGLKFKHYVLYVGALEPRKNIGGLARAYAGIDTDIPLVMVGKHHKLWEEETRRLALIKNVHILDYISHEDLSCLYAGASVFVFPSFYEGFGLPPLEAMTFGCPVITSDVSSLPELYGDAVLYVNPSDVLDIRQKIEQVLSNAELRDRLSAAGLERAKKFSMDNFISGLWAGYEKVLGR